MCSSSFWQEIYIFCRNHAVKSQCMAAYKAACWLYFVSSSEQNFLPWPLIPAVSDLGHRRYFFFYVVYGEHLNKLFTSSFLFWSEKGEPSSAADNSTYSHLL